MDGKGGGVKTSRPVDRKSNDEVEWVGLEEAARMLRTGTEADAFRGAWSRIEHAVLRGEVATVGQSIVSARQVRLGGAERVQVAFKDIEKIGRAIGSTVTLRQKTERWVDVREAKKALRVTGTRIIERAFADFEAEWRKGGAVVRNGRHVAFAVMRRGNARVFCLGAEELPWLATVLKLDLPAQAPKREDEVSIYEAALALGVSASDLAAPWDEMERSLRSAGRPEIGGVAMRFRIVQGARGRRLPVLAREELPHVACVLGLASEEPEAEIGQLP